jgi:hypothetical protein
MKQRVDMRIDVELLKRVDEARGKTSRTAFTEEALAAMLYPPRRIVKTVGSQQRSPVLHRQDDLARKIKAKMAQGKTSRLAEIEAREELGL